MNDDLVRWLHQQFENQRFRGESLKTLAHALPAETGAYLTQTAELLLADVAAKWRIVDECEADLRQRGDGALRGEVDRPTWTVLTLLALSYANQPGYKQEWRP